MRARWTWGGFGGAGLLAISAWCAGALPAGDPGAGFRTGGFGAVPGSFTIGLICWLAGIVLLGTAWVRLLRPGSDDRHPVDGEQTETGARRARTVVHRQPWTTTVGIGVLWSLPLLAAPPLGSRDIYAYACQGWLWWHGSDPYAMGVAQGGCPWAASVPQLWQDTPTPYGPLAVVLSGLAAATGNQLTAIVLLRVIAIAAALLLAWQLPRLAIHCGQSPDRARWLGLITPLVLVHGISGGHNDIVVAALIVTALNLAVKSRSDSPDFGEVRQSHRRESRISPKSGESLAVGLLIAGAVAIKVTAVVVVPFVLLLIGRRWMMSAVTGGIAFVGLSLGSGLGLGWVNALRHTGELAQWSSIPTAVGMTAGYLLRPFGIIGPEPIAGARIIGVIVLAVVTILLLRKAWRERLHTGEVVLAGGTVLAATVLLGPVFYPWYAIAPLAVLAAARAPAWIPAVTIACTALTLPNGLGVPVLTKAVGAFAVTAAVITLSAQALIRTRSPGPAA